MKWARSVLDFSWHVIDERRRHPGGMLQAECGHLLMSHITLRDEHDGRPCEACAAVKVTR